MEHAEVVDGGLLEAAEDAAKLLEPADEPLDDVAAAVGVSVESGVAGIVGPRPLLGDHSLDALQLERVDDCGRAVGLVTRQGVRLNQVPQRRVADFGLVPQFIEELRFVRLAGTQGDA